MKKAAGIGFGILAAIGAALVLPSAFGEKDSYEWADETEMKSYGVTDAELAKLTKAYEARLMRRGGSKLDADTVSTRYIYVAVANSQAAEVQRLLRGVMCPAGDAAKKAECDARFSAANAGRACNAAGDKVAYVVGFPVTTAQRSVLGKWRSAFNLTHVVSVPMADFRQGSLQFWDELETLYNVKRCPLGDLTP